MKVVVTNLYSEVKKTIEGGPDKVAQELVRLYPWLNKADPDRRGDVPAMVSRLNRDQAFQAAIVDLGEPMKKTEPRNLPDQEDHVVQAMLGHHHKINQSFAAAKFLSGHPEVPEHERRAALYAADGDHDEAALQAHGLEATPGNRKALRAVKDMSEARKAEPEPVAPQEVQAGHPDAQEASEEVSKAFQDRFVMPVQLGGKHSQGSMLARDNGTGHVWLLKPGSGGQTPAAGAQQDGASQSRREAAYYHMAAAWHLENFFPQAELLLIDGKEYAAIRLLPWKYETMDKLKDQHEGVAQSILHDYLKNGTLHRWAFLDYVLGNPDRHAANLMVDDRDVKLIDHGSAMGGSAFDPAHDQNSFTPYYLRAWAPGRFSKLSAEDKLKYMPRLDQASASQLGTWISDLHAEDLDRVLFRYGVDPQPAKDRLARVKMQMIQDPPDLALNKLWATT